MCVEEETQQEIRYIIIERLYTDIQHNGRTYCTLKFSQGMYIHVTPVDNFTKRR